MREHMLQRAVKETRLQRQDPRAVQLLPNVFVVRLKCLRLRPRCTHWTIGLRRASEWVDWRASTCAKCGSRMLPGVERYAELEVNAAVQLLRWRPIDLETREPAGDWQVLPFAMAGQLDDLAAG